MILDTFVKDAIRTESKIENVTLNPIVFTQIITAMIALGSILDQIKKHTFYKKPYNTLDIANNLADATEALTVLSHEFQYNWPLPAGERTVAINPRIFHAVVGIATESVELLQAIDLNSPDVDKVNLLEEFGDIDWYQAIGIDAVDGTLEQVLERVIAKLKARYGEKFSSDSAINRDLVKERKILEGNPAPMLKDIDLR